MGSPLFLVYYDLGLGGVQRKIVDLVNFLSTVRPNLDIHILLRRKSSFSLARQIINKKVSLYYYCDWYKVRIPVFFPVFVFYKTWKMNPRAILAFSDSSALSAIWATHLLPWRSIRVVVGEDRYVPAEVATYRFAQLRQFLIRRFYPFADAIFSPSPEMAQDLVHSCKLPKDKVKIIENWVTPGQKKLADTTKVYDLIYVGRLTSVKNLTFLLEGIKKLRENKESIRLCLVGEGDRMNYLQSWVYSHGIRSNVLFAGATQNVEKYLAKSKIFVISSKAEGLPMSMLEAMVHGIPVLASDYPGILGIIKNGKAGYVYSNLGDFVKKATRLLDDATLRTEKGKAARAYVMKYHSSQNINLYLEALQI